MATRRTRRGFDGLVHFLHPKVGAWCTVVVGVLYRDDPAHTVVTCLWCVCQVPINRG